MNWKTLITSIISSLFICLLLLQYRSKEQKIAVVDAVQLFNNYHMKIELENIEKKKLLSLSKQIDSINNLLGIAGSIHNDEATKELMKMSSSLKQQLEQEYEKGNKAINDEVWKRLNAAIEKFGTKKQLHLIIGANGMGTVLYNDSYYDLTSEAIKFVNKQYEEGN